MKNHSAESNHFSLGEHTSIWSEFYLIQIQPTKMNHFITINIIYLYKSSFLYLSDQTNALVDLFT